MTGLREGSSIFVFGSEAWVSDYARRSAVYAIVTIGGYQFRAEPGQRLQVPLLEISGGEEISFEQVHLLAPGDGSAPIVGRPHVEGARVRARVLGSGRGPKIVVGKYKRRRDYHRKKGHRTWFTEIEILEVVAP